MIRIENWSLCIRGYGSYMFPDEQRVSLQGNVYGHPKFKDGEFVVTSQVLDLDISNGKAETRSREYVLGQANPDWISWLKENKFTKYVNEIEKLSSTFLN